MRRRLAALVVAGAAAWGEVCSQRPAQYEVAGYRVRSARIWAPLELPGKIRGEIAAEEARLTVRKGEAFRAEEMSRSFGRVRDAFGELRVAAGERVRLSVVTPVLENCRDGELDVVFRVFTTESALAVARVFEGRMDRVTRQLAPGTVGETIGKVLARPGVGYGPARGVTGGGSVSFEQDAGVFPRAEAAAMVGNGNAETAVSLAGGRALTGRLWERMDWRVGHRYGDVAGVRGAVGYGQVTAGSKALGEMGWLFRFGTAVEGGNRGVRGDVPGGTAAGVRHGAVKSFAGTTFNTGRQAFTVSYGAQFGSAGLGIGLDYVKHVVDAGHTGRILWREHHPLRVENRFTAGGFSRAGGAPLAELYCGGGQVADFVDGAEWRIRTGPTIRSFPENRLARSGAGAFGGTSFYSYNFTAGVTVWSRAAVPVEIGRDPEIRIALVGAIEGARRATVMSYLQETEEARELRVAIGEVEAALRAVEATGELAEQVEEVLEAAGEARKELGKVRGLVVGFEGVPSLVEELEEAIGAGGAARLRAAREAAAARYAGVMALARQDGTEVDRARPAVSELAEAVKAAGLATAAQPGARRAERYLEAMGRALEDAQADDATLALAGMGRLAVGHGEVAEALAGGAARELRALGLTAEARRLHDAGERLRARVREVRRPAVEQRAARDAAYTGRVLDVTFREMSLFSVSPVFVFDAARLGPAAGVGTRYGVGGGVRISIVSMDMTAGYAHNPAQRPGEPRGAFFFSLDVADLFR